MSSTANASATAASASLKKEEVPAKLEAKELVLVKRDKDTSPVWKCFSAIHFAQSNEYAGFVRCNTCGFIYCFKKGSSPSTLTRHKCVSSSRNTKNATVSNETKDAVLKACVDLCAWDLRPFNTVKGPGFQRLSQLLLDIGGKYAKAGQISGTDVLPHPSTVSRNISEIAESLRQQFLPEVKECLLDRACAFDADLWTEKFTQTHYLTITCQYVTRDFKLRSQVLCTTEFPAEEAKTGLNIKKDILSEMARLGFSGKDLLEKATFVTDQGSNIKLALSEFRRLPCVAHCLATVLRHCLDDEKFLKDNAPGVYELLRTCRNIVSHLKRTGMSKQLSKSVKNMVETRWSSCVNMLESVAESMDEIVQLFLKRGEMNRLDGWNGELATKLIHFLSAFRNVTDELQAKKKPTLHFVLVRFYDLLDLCSNDSFDDSFYAGTDSMSTVSSN